MPYDIQYSDIAKDPISVADGSLNQETSLTFIGKNYNQSYSSIIGENFLYLLENFAKSTPPTTPVEGQLWYNLSEGSIDNGLKVFDGTNWIPLGVIKKGVGDPPPISTSLPFKIGDLYVDTTKQQLYIYGENRWTLVGPKYQTGDKTTAEVETIIDAASNIPRAILTLFVKNNRVAIISEREFTPKTLIDGFSVIKQGITLSTTKFQTPTKINKFWGVSEKAESLLVGDIAVDSIKFLRSDIVSTTYQTFNVQNNNGISIGQDLKLSLGIDSTTNSSIIYNGISGSRTTFKLLNNGQIKSVMTIDAESKVGINKTAPVEALDVVGNIKTDSSVIISGTNNDYDVSNPDSPSFKTLGGAWINKSLKVVNNLIIGGTSTLGNNTTIQGQLILEKTSGPVLLPVSPTDTYLDIGTGVQKFGDVYAKNFRGIANSAISSKYLDNGIAIKIQSNDITAPEIIIGSSVETLENNVLVPSLNSQIIYTKSSPDQVSALANKSLSLLNSDLVLVSRKLNNNPDDNTYQLVKLTGAQVLSSFTKSTIQIGSIILWPNINAIPSGYVLCDGRSLPKTEYQALFDVLGVASFLDAGILKFIIPTLTAPGGMNYIIYTGKI
jgi:hypothetical protein